MHLILDLLYSEESVALPPTMLRVHLALNIYHNPAVVEVAWFLNTISTTLEDFTLTFAEWDGITKPRKYVSKQLYTR